MSIGLANIWAGGDVRESLQASTLLDDDAMLRMVTALKTGNKEPLALEPT